MGLKTREELKKLQSMVSSLEASIAVLKTQEEQIKRELSTKKMDINHLKQRITNLSKRADGITVSEHAIIRYIERVMGIDIEDIATKILPESAQEYIEQLGNGHYPVNHGEFKIVVKDGVVITVLTPDVMKG